MGSKWNATKRVVGAEFRAAVWTARHPGSVIAPTVVATSVAELGPIATGSIAGGLAVGTFAWYRAHPGTFDVLAAPRLRSWRRRWIGEYVGPRWQNLMDACGLYREHRRTGRIHYPRVVKVRAYSPSIDCVWLQLVRGQHVSDFQSRLGPLADALKAERVAVERTKPGQIALVIQRDEPFTHIIPAPDMPVEAEDVDLRAVYLGEDEYGNDWTEPLIGPRPHRLTAGATGAGKNSIAYATARSVAPLIRDGLVRPWICDPKMLEFIGLKPITGGRYADDAASCLELIEEYVDNMQRTQRRMQAAGLRSVPVSPEYPLNWLIIDEIGSLVAYDPVHARDITALLARAASMGRTTHHVLDAYIQEPSKDVLEIRDLFPNRICLRVTSATHPDMVLGDDARAKGAIADQIPAIPETAGIGYRMAPRSRAPMRVRAAYTADEDITELVEFIRNGATGLRVVA